MRKALVLVVALLVGFVATRTGVPSLSPPPAPALSGKEQPRPGAIFVNGFNIEDPLRDTYARSRAWLGEPVTAFDGRCQRFRFGELCYEPGNDPAWVVQFANLGRQDMEIEGYRPVANASPSPALKDWLRAHYEVGLDITRTIGPVISEPHCTPTVCVQWTMKTRFEFPPNATSASQVRRAPVGLYLTYPWIRTQEQARYQAPRPNPTLWVVLPVGGGVLGLWVLLRRHTSSRGDPYSL